MANNIITLVGSREVPRSVLDVAEQLGAAFSERGWVGRSGGAVGMDQAFMRRYSPALSEIYRPDGKGGAIDVTKFANFADAEDIARSVIPHFEYMDFYSQWLHTRNAYQVLGRDLDTPSKMLLCWAPERKGIVTGGTRTAVTIAKLNNIPVFNLWHQDVMERFCTKFGVPLPPVPKQSSITGTLDFLE